MERCWGKTLLERETDNGVAIVLGVTVVTVTPSPKPLFRNLLMKNRDMEIVLHIPIFD